MGGLLMLLGLSAAMTLASFLAGILPLSISLSRSQLRLISSIGTGVLVGTSLIVIIPEGIETLYKSNEITHSHTRRDAGLRTLGVRWDHTSTFVRTVRHPREDIDLSGILPNELFDLPGLALPDTAVDPPRTPVDSGTFGALKNEGADSEDHAEKDEPQDEAHHAWVGVALISGFILMFLIDKMPQLKSSPKARAKTHNIALNHIGRRFNLSGGPDHEDENENENEGFLESNHTPETPARGSATTIGLIIHAAADGIALGASSSTAHTGLSLVIFFAIMIHKAPAAFGLTSILLRQGLSKRTIRAHLVLFSLAAPIGALATWTAARFIGSGQVEGGSHTKWWTGVLLLFSAGTFLYVAMHSMQQVLGDRHDKQQMNGHANGSLERHDGNMEQQDEQNLSFTDIGAAVFGMILPLFLQAGHAH